MFELMVSSFVEWFECENPDHKPMELATLIYWISGRVNELVKDTYQLVGRPRCKGHVSGITVRPVELPLSQRILF